MPHPTITPLRENRLKGIHGSTIGVITHPARYAANKLTNDLLPLTHAISTE